MCPNKGSNLQPRYVAWLVIEPTIFWCTGQQSPIETPDWGINFNSLLVDKPLVAQTQGPSPLCPCKWPPWEVGLPAGQIDSWVFYVDDYVSSKKDSSLVCLNCYSPYSFSLSLYQLAHLVKCCTVVRMISTFPFFWFWWQRLLLTHRLLCVLL